MVFFIDITDVKNWDNFIQSPHPFNSPTEQKGLYWSYSQGVKLSSTLLHKNSLAICITWWKGYSRKISFWKMVYSLKVFAAYLQKWASSVSNWTDYLFAWQINWKLNCTLLWENMNRFWAWAFITHLWDVSSVRDTRLILISPPRQLNLPKSFHLSSTWLSGSIKDAKFSFTGTKCRLSVTFAKPMTTVVRIAHGTRAIYSFNICTYFLLINRVRLHLKYNTC